MNTKKETSNKTKSMREMRSLAFHFLYVAESYQYSISLDDIVNNFIVGFNLKIEPDSLEVQLAKGVIEQREELDKIIKPLLKNWKIERLGCCTLLILRLAIWELQQKKAGPSIIINEAIELAKCFAEKDSYKFINGILDEVCRQMGIRDDKLKKGNNNEQ